MSSKLPHISITVEGSEKGSAASGKFSILSIGFGIHQAWIYAAMFGTHNIFGSATTLELFNNSAFQFSPATLVFIISIIVFSACLLFASATDQKFLKFYVSKGTLVSAAVLTSLGTFAVFAAGLDSLIGWIALWFAGISTGIGSTLLLLSWGTAFSRHNVITILLNTAIAIVIAVSTYSMILHWLPIPISGIVTSLLPLITLVFLWKLTPTPYNIRNEVPIFSPLPIKKRLFLLRFGAPVLIFGFALGALRAVSMQAILPQPDINSQLITWAASGIAMIITLLMIFGAAKERHWDLLFRSLLPFIVIAILALPFIRIGGDLFVGLLLLVGFMCFEALMWIFFGELSQKFRLSPIFVFGLGRGLLAISSLAGSMLTLYAPHGLFIDAFGNIGGEILLLLSMVIAYALLPRQREVAALVNHESAIPKHSAVAQLNEESDAPKPKSPDVNNASPVVPDINKSGRFRQQCEIIANRYLLSRRETEVLFLLAKGHKATYIQEQLFISKSTVKTHTNHIYRKLDIHTQQELIELIDSVKSEVVMRRLNDDKAILLAKEEISQRTIFE